MEQGSQSPGWDWCGAGAERGFGGFPLVSFNNLALLLKVQLSISFNILPLAYKEACEASSFQF